MRMTKHEIGLVSTLLSILLIGAIVRHYRYAARESARAGQRVEASVPASPKQSPYVSMKSASARQEPEE